MITPFDYIKPFTHHPWLCLGRSLLAFAVCAGGIVGFTGCGSHADPKEQPQMPLPAVQSPREKASALLVTSDRTVTLDCTNAGLTQDHFVNFDYKCDTKKLIATWVFAHDSINHDSVPPPRYFTLTVPRSCRLQVILPDQTELWLNAESTIFFPVPFPKNERYLELVGEAFIKVDEDVSAAPFRVGLRNLPGSNRIVQLNNAECNIRAYPGSGQVEIMPLKGQAVFSYPDNPSLKKTICKPMHRLAINSQGSLSVTALKEPVPVITSWTRGTFSFWHTPIQEVMGQIQRWYDVEISFKDTLKVDYTGRILMTMSLQEALDVLESLGPARFTIEGRKLVVSRL